MALPEKWLCHALPLVKVQRKSLHYPTMFVLDHYHFRKLSRKNGAMFAPTPSLNGQGTNCKLCPHRWRCPKLRTSSSAVGGFMDRNRILILVGGFNHLEKYEFVNGKDDIPYEMENKKCSKPPTRICIWVSESKSDDLCILRWPSVDMLRITTHHYASLCCKRYRPIIHL
jgi:hypothetical protein